MKHIINTVGSKIIRALEIIRVKKLVPKQILRANICQVMIVRLYAVYNKHEIIKIGIYIREKSQVLSQVLEEFCCRLYAFLSVKTEKFRVTDKVQLIKKRKKKNLSTL